MRRAAAGGSVEWYRRLAREAHASNFEEFDLVYHVSVWPATPPEYETPGMVALTFRLHDRPRGGFVYCTTIDLGAALRLGTRFGLDEAGALALVDSHERMHVHLQLAGVSYENEESAARRVDAVYLSFATRVPLVVAERELDEVASIASADGESLVDLGEDR